MGSLCSCGVFMVSHQVGFGRKSFELLYGTGKKKKGKSAVVPEQIKRKPSEFLPITISGGSVHIVKDARKRKMMYEAPFLKITISVVYFSHFCNNNNTVAFIIQIVKLFLFSCLKEIRYEVGAFENCRQTCTVYVHADLFHSSWPPQLVEIQGLQYICSNCS